LPAATVRWPVVGGVAAAALCAGLIVSLVQVVHVSAQRARAAAAAASFIAEARARCAWLYADAERRQCLVTSLAPRALALARGSEGADTAAVSVAPSPSRTPDISGPLHTGEVLAAGDAADLGLPPVALGWLDRHGQPIGISARIPSRPGPNRTGGLAGQRETSSALPGPARGLPS